MKKKQNKYFIAFITVLILTIPMTNINSQKMWSLDECVQYAWEHNLLILQKDYKLQNARVNYQSSIANLSPRVSANASVGINSGRTINNDNNQFVNQTYNSGYAGLSAELIVFSGFEQYHSIVSAKYMARSVQKETEVIKNVVMLQIVAAYIDVLRNQELIEAARQRLAGVETLKEKAEQSLNIGKSSREDYLLIVAQHAKEKEQFIASSNQLILSKRQLIVLMNIDSIQTISINKPTQFIEEYAYDCSVDSIFAYAVEQMPEISSNDYMLKATAHNIWQQRGALSPKISISAGYDSRYSDLSLNPKGEGLPYSYMNQLSDKAGSQVSLNIYIPLFNRMQTRSNINRSKIALNEAKNELSLAKQNLYNDIQKAMIEANGAYEKMNAKKATTESFEEAFRYMEEKFSRGMVSATDLIVAGNNYTSSNSEYIMARYEYLYRMKILDFYEGRRISLQ